MKLLRLKISKYLLICLSLLILTACSYSPNTLKNSYNNLGKEYVRELKQMTDYTPEQSEKLDVFAKDLMQWHRENKLPAYARLMHSLSSKMETPQGLSNTDLHAFIKFMTSYPNFHESTKNNVQLAKLATSLSDKQFIQLRTQIEDESRDFNEMMQQTSWEKRKRDGVKGLADLFSYLDVNLTNKQLNIVRKHVNYQRDLKGLYIASNEKWNNTLIDLLSKRQEHGFVKKFAQHLSNDNLRKRLLKVAPVELKHSDQISVNMYRELFASFTKQQKTTLVSQLKSISKTLTELIKG